MSILLGSGFTPADYEPEPVTKPSEADVAALRLELVLEALEGLRDSLTNLPRPEVFIDAPDLSAIVTAVNGLKPGADADEIAAAVVRQIAPMSAPATPDALYPELIDVLKKLDFRMKGSGTTGTTFNGRFDSNGALIVSSSGSAVDTSLLAKEATLASLKTAATNSNATGTLTAAWDGVSPATAPAGSVVTYTVPDSHSSWSITLGGTFSAGSVVNFEGSEDGVFWFALNGRRNLDSATNDTTNLLDANPSGGPGPTGSNPSHWRGSAGGVRFMRVRCSTYTAADSIAVGIYSSAGVGAVFLNSPTVTRTDIGAYVVAAGTGSATVTPTSTQRIQSIAVIAPTGSIATVQIASQPVVTIPAGQQVALNPNSNLKGTAYPVAVTGSASYVVELVG